MATAGLGKYFRTTPEILKTYLVRATPGARTYRVCIAERTAVRRRFAPRFALESESWRRWNLGSWIRTFSRSRIERSKHPEKPCGLGSVAADLALDRVLGLILDFRKPHSAQGAFFPIRVSSTTAPAGQPHSKGIL